MTPLELAFKYMEIFYSGRNLERLTSVLHENLNFHGPLYTFQSSKDYIQSLMQSPPKNMSYQIIQSYSQTDNACLIYELRKDKLSMPIAQHFEIRDNLIFKIILIFDSKSLLDS